MKNNASMQRLNNMSAIEIQVNDTIQNADDEVNAVNNRSITPLAKKGFQIRDVSPMIANRNKSHQRLGALSQISVATTAKSLKFNEDVKTKLAYEWKNLYRALAQSDIERKGTVPLSTFNKIIHQHKVYLSREELRKIEQLYGASQANIRGSNGTCLLQEVDYVKIS